LPNANDERIMLAWSLISAGKREEARKLVPFGFFPPVSPDPSLRAVTYSRMTKILQDLK
jgi:hypothetical protein